MLTCLTHYRPAMPFGNRKKHILEDLFSLVLSQFKKYHPSGNGKFNNIAIFRSLKLRTLVEKILPISLKLNLTPHTLRCYGQMFFTVHLLLSRLSVELRDERFDKCELNRVYVGYALSPFFFQNRKAAMVSRYNYDRAGTAT